MSYKPEYDGPIKGWTVNHLTTNYWRVESTMERDDVMQESYLVFLRCAAKYPDMDTPQHFMALYKRAWSNEFTDLANADTASRIFVGDRALGKPEARDFIGDTDNDGALNIAIQQAPSEVAAVLQLFLCAPQELLDLALSGWRGVDRRKAAGGSDRINKLLGLPLGRDVLEETRQYFGR